MSLCSDKFEFYKIRFRLYFRFLFQRISLCYINFGAKFWRSLPTILGYGDVTTTKLSNVEKNCLFLKIAYFFQNREEGSGGVTLRKSVYRKGLFHLMNETINPGILSKSQKATINPFTQQCQYSWPAQTFFSGRFIVFLSYFFFQLNYSNSCNGNHSFIAYNQA